MCRLLLYAGSLVKPVLWDLATALLRSAEHDIIGILAGIDENHPDGWGLYYIDFTKGIKFLFKSGNALFREKELYIDILRRILEHSTEGDKCVLLAHVRAASEGEPLGLTHSHPYIYHVHQGGAEIVFAHNGAVFKNKLAEKLQVDSSKFTDSYIAGLYIATQLERKVDINAILADLMLNYTKTAFMTVTLIVSNSSCDIYITSHIAEQYLHRVAYYRLFRVDVGEDARAYISSTLAYYIYVEGTGSNSAKFPAVPLPIHFYSEHIEIR